MIGIDALAEQRLMMDFDKRLIKIEDASKPAKPRPRRHRDHRPPPTRPIDPDPGPRPGYRSMR